MPELTDIFTPDAFGVYALTEAIQKIPPQKLTIADLGIFREMPIATTLVAIEEDRGVLTLVPTTPRGGPGIPAQSGKRVLTSFKVPHIQLDDTVHADDVINIRAFGASGVSTEADVVGRKLASMRRSVDFTNEFLRFGALQGKVLYPDNSYEAALDLYTSFGMTNQATNQTNVDFVTGTATTDIAGIVIPQIFDAIEAALGGAPYSGVVALCGRTFFRKLIGHAMIKGLYLQQQQQYNLAAVGRAPGDVGRMIFTLNGVTFIEYYNIAGGSQGIGNDGLFQVAAEARAFPVGVDIYHTYYAPADISEAIGTLGQPVYAYTLPHADKKGVGLVVQSNPLNICLRPKALIRLHTSN